MGYLLTRTFTTTCPSELITAVNDDAEIGALLEQLVNNGGPTTDFWFDSPLDVDEESAFDNILGSWDCNAPANEPPPDPDAVIIEQSIEMKRDKIAGVEGRGESWTEFDFDTGVYSIYPNPTQDDVEFKVWSYNERFTKTENESVTVPLVSMEYIIYYNELGVLTVTDNITIDPLFKEELRENSAIIARVSVDIATPVHIHILDLRYDVDMDPATRNTFVGTHGLVYKSGLALQNISVDGTGDIDTDAQFSVQDGRVDLADIVYYTSNRQQQLTFPAQIPIFYKLGQGWKIKLQDDFPLIYTGTVGTDYIEEGLPYNDIDPVTGDGALFEVAENDFVCVHYFASPGLYRGIVGVQGQFQYPTKGLARDGALHEVEILVTSAMAGAFFTPIGTVIFQSSSANKTNIPHAEIVSTDEGEDYVDTRFSKESFGSSQGITDVVVKDTDFAIVDHRLQKLKFDMQYTDPEINQVVTWYPSQTSIDFRTVPQYALQATSSMPLTQFQEVSLDVNGNVQGYPATSGEGGSIYSERTGVTIATLAYTGSGTGVVGFVDGTANSFILRSGTQQEDGTVIWTAELVVSGLRGNVIEIASTKIDGTQCGFCWVTDQGSMGGVVANTIPNGDVTITNTYELETSGVISADLTYNPLRGHILFGYGTSSMKYNVYLSIDNGGNLIKPKNRRSFDFGTPLVKMEVAQGYDDIIYQALCDDGWVYWASSRWDSKRNDYRKNGDDDGVQGGALSLHGVESANGYIFGQFKVGTNTYQTKFASYSPGGSINPWTDFGGPLTAKAAKLVNTATGLGYNVTVNEADQMTVYEGNAANPNAGFEKVYTSVNLMTGVTENLCVTMFENVWASVATGSGVPNQVMFINSNDVRTDNYIGNCQSAVAQGELATILLGLPVIAHAANYSPGNIFYLGPYKYQAITRNQVVVILEEVVPLSASGG